MGRKTVSGIMLSLLLIDMLILTFNIQPVKASGTIYIRADGSVDPDTAPISSADNITYTFTENIIDDYIIVQRDNIVVDGVGYTLQGWPDAIGIDLSGRSNVTIKNMEIKAFTCGIWLYDSSNNRISGNNITENYYDGIRLWNSSNNSISGNVITGNPHGIELYYSSNNTLRNNDARNNIRNFGVYGSLLSHYVQDIDDSNTVNGKPVYYWVNRRDLTVPLDAGWIALVNCTSITVKNLNLTNNGQGALLASTTNSAITKNNITNNSDGIYLFESSGNSISGNNVANNGYGILLDNSSYNIINQNNVTENSKYGIWFRYSSNYNSISENNITNNRHGIVLMPESSGSISGNNITENNQYGIWLTLSSGNSISGNNVANNEGGILLWESSNNNSVSGNNITNNEFGIDLWVSSNNKIYHNNFIVNMDQAYDTVGYVNIWDNGYPSGGNYWSDYTGVDVKTGPNQDQPSSDGIGDTAYVIGADIRDRYPLMYTGPYYQLTVTSSPITGITFTINGAQKTTPYTEWLLEGSYTLVMPETHNGYVFSHWLEDGDPNRIKTFLLQGTTWTAVYEPAPKPVGGKATPINIPMNKPETPTLWIWLTTIILSLIVTVLYVKRRKRNTRTLPYVKC